MARLESPFREVLDLILVIDDVAENTDMRSYLRICDVFSVPQINLCGVLSDIKVNPMGLEKYITLARYPSTADCINHLKEEGFRIVALEFTPNCTPISI